MPDPARQPGRETLTLADHQAVIEKLLLSGLDRYFAGQYERAIQVWTRVFFLDRTHARARAYIERARSAIAERQRESDELLAGGLSALNAGDAGRARDLLTSAVDRGGWEVEALTALDRLNRLTAFTAAGAPPADGSEPMSRRARVNRSAWVGPSAWVGIVPQAVLAAAAVMLLGVGVWVVLDWDRVSGWWQGTTSADSASASVTVEPLPLPDPSALVLDRAQALYERGALQQALLELADIPPGDARSAEASVLGAEIQRAMLSSILDRPAPRPAPPDHKNAQR
ncbi:MAG: hypothetical protein GEU99_07050 [Luteitalea sp.]|nr:hypothetical protein [Luteitalea sp.]